MSDLRRSVRGAGPKRHQGPLSLLRRRAARTPAVGTRPAGHRPCNHRANLRRSTAGRLLRRILRPIVPLSRLDLLLHRLADRTPTRADEPGRPLAAVAIVLAPDPDAVLLIRRADREGDHWSGHLALPGGRWSPGDDDLIVTARRETLEETGVELQGADPVAALDDLAPRNPILPPILVRPFVFVVPEQLPLRPNHEVAGAWWVPLEALLDPAAFRPYEYRRQDRSLQTVGYHLEVGVLWGMTERILTPMLRLFADATAAQAGLTSAPPASGRDR